MWVMICLMSLLKLMPKRSQFVILSLTSNYSYLAIFVCVCVYFISFMSYLCYCWIDPEEQKNGKMNKNAPH